jgi:hypothetical protein
MLHANRRRLLGVVSVLGALAALWATAGAPIGTYF